MSNKIGIGMLDEDEGDAYELHRKADELYRKQDFAGAIEYYTRALDLKPDLFETRFNRSLAFLRKSENLKALEDLNRCIEIDPKLAELYYTRALAKEYEKDYPQAALDYARAQREARDQRTMLAGHAPGDSPQARRPDPAGHPVARAAGDRQDASGPDLREHGSGRVLQREGNGSAADAALCVPVRGRRAER